MIRYVLTEHVRRAWDHNPDPPELALIQWAASQFGSPVRSFVDVGAHVGSWALNLARYFEYVHAFEPQLEQFNALCGGIALNGLDGFVHAHKLAISDRDGTALLRIISADGGGSSIVALPHNVEASIEKVFTARLDSIDHLGDVALIKLDCEGAELAALRGAEALIARCRPKIIFECWQGDWWQDQRRELADYIHRNLDYQIWEINNFPQMFLAEPVPV